MKPAVLVTRRWPEAVETRLAGHFDVTLNVKDTPLSKEDLKDAFQSHDAIFTTVTDKIDQDVLAGGGPSAPV